MNIIFSHYYIPLRLCLFHAQNSKIFDKLLNRQNISFAKFLFFLTYVFLHVLLHDLCLYIVPFLSLSSPFYKSTSFLFIFSSFGISFLLSFFPLPHSVAQPKTIRNTSIYSQRQNICYDVTLRWIII